MRLAALAALLLCVFVSSVAAWSKEDHEIFRLRDEVVASEGPDTTFYSFIGVAPAASQDEINKAYRKKSRQIHPDKARQAYLSTYAKPTKKDKKKAGVTVRKQPSAKELRQFDKEASARFARLGVVANILRGPERERYDHFLKNGFPAWRGTGYYYSRYRPGLGSVLVGLFAMMGGAAHYGALYLGWKRQRDFVDRYIRHARRAAWGDELGIQGIPGGLGGDSGTSTPVEQPAPQEQQYVDENGQPVTLNRRQKRMQEKEARKEGKGPKNAKAAKKARNSGVSTPVEAELTSGGPRGPKKRVQAENGKILIVDSAGNVFLEEETEDGDVHEFLLDVDEIPKPTFLDTAVVRLPVWFYKKSVGRLFGKSSSDVAVDAAAEDLEVEIDENGASNGDADAKGANDALKSATAINANAETRKRKVRRAK
ncbi:putative J domain-containing protein C2E1P5.03 [Lasiodiplodia hormozganensis]|uniref:J domain-containing protein C2E1P5.03 n=1 Tax=Lasiodiplodia hormozganensis TaxID=869390 RepID=A0AA39WVA6_9PEZI|nr:putative J domain-containing protein C2E1P5.03 [Lasiodiplodia hormozganensis]